MVRDWNLEMFVCSARLQIISLILICGSSVDRNEKTYVFFHGGRFILWYFKSQ